MNYIVGLTGGIGCGKSTVGNLFKALGINVVDADNIAKQLVSYGTKEWEKIVSFLGHSILLDNNEINRIKLRNIIFNDSTKKQWLESILIPAIKEKVQMQLHISSNSYAILMAPLLIEKNFHYLCDSILVVDVDEKTQIDRVSARDHNSYHLIQKIMESQLSRTERLNFATEVIENNLDIKDGFIFLAQKVLNLHNYYLSKSKQ